MIGGVASWSVKNDLYRFKNNEGWRNFLCLSTVLQLVSHFWNKVLPYFVFPGSLRKNSKVQNVFVRASWRSFVLSHIHNKYTLTIFFHGRPHFFEFVPNTLVLLPLISNTFMTTVLELRMLLEYWLWFFNLHFHIIQKKAVSIRKK